MDFSGFYRKIADTGIILKNAADIARFSFLVQDSVSYLDLGNPRKNSTTRRNDFGLFCNSCRSTKSMQYVNTEEKCRMFFSPKRRLLYTLHLEVAKGRERSLKNDAAYTLFFRMCCRETHVAKVTFNRERFHRQCVSKFVEEALKNNVPKKKILKFTLKLLIGGESLLSRLDATTAAQFVDCFYPEVTDFALFRDFMLHFDIVEWMRLHNEPEVLEHLLYHARLFGNNSLKSRKFEDHAFYTNHRNIGPILKSISDLKPASNSFNHYYDIFFLERPYLTRLIRARPRTRKTERRSCFLMQMFAAYDDSLNGSKEATEALRLVWSSVPDPCVTRDELQDVFGSLIGEEELTSVFQFYVDSIGEFHEVAEPRSLQHLCRIALRRRFAEKGVWIPDAVGRTGLPKSLQAFLKLE